MGGHFIADRWFSDNQAASSVAYEVATLIPKAIRLITKPTSGSTS
jgi:hypothetical protein